MSLPRSLNANLQPQSLGDQALAEEHVSLTCWIARHTVQASGAPRSPEMTTAIDALRRIERELESRTASRMACTSPRSQEERQAVRLERRAAFQRTIAGRPSYHAIISEGAIVGYYYEEAGIRKVFSLEGALLWMNEGGLESPAVDPVTVLVSVAVPVGGLASGTWRMAPTTLQSLGYWAFGMPVRAVVPTGRALAQTSRALAQRGIEEAVSSTLVQSLRNPPVQHAYNAARRSYHRSPDPDGFTPGTRNIPVRGPQTWCGPAIHYIPGGVFGHLLQLR
jgi:hypothetical protein